MYTLFGSWNLLHTNFHGKEVEWEVSFYYWKTFLIIFNKLLYFFVYELIYMLFENNKFSWKLQLRYVGLLVELSIFSSNVYCCCFYSFDSFYQHCFSLGWYIYIYFFFVNRRESLSSLVTSSCFTWNKMRKYIQNGFV